MFNYKEKNLRRLKDVRIDIKLKMKKSKITTVFYLIYTTASSKFVKSLVWHKVAIVIAITIIKIRL